MRLTLIAVALLATFTAGAESWSLDSCISYALSHNLTVRQRQLDVVDSRLGVTEARDAYLPTVNASAQESWAFGRGLTSENTYANRNTSQFGWNVGVTLPLFQGLSAYRNEQVARASLGALVEQVEAVKDDITINVIGQYLQALYCHEVLEVAHTQRNISAQEVERRQTLLDAGKIPETDLLEARSQLAADELTVVTSDNSLRLALLDLAQTLQLGEEADSFDILPLTDEQSRVLPAEVVYENALRNNPTLIAARRQVDVADRRIALARSGYLPRLSFSVGLGSTYYRLNGEENPSFGRQMRDNYSTSLGFSLSIPIFDAFSTRNSVRRARVQRLNAELAVETAESDLFHAIQNAYYQAVNAERKITASEAARTSAQAAFEAMQVKYNFGRATATEFEQAKAAYIKASMEYVQAKMELILRSRILEFYNRREVNF